MAPSCMCIYSTRFTPRRIGQNPYQALYLQLYLYSSHGLVAAKIQEPKLIESIIRFFFGDDVEVVEDVIATSLEAFKTHSQASFS